ncbi:MAG: ribonuclease J [Chloroflexi bacterium]|nr:ribonuclease J [Chloroflexota bacterium]
MAKNKVRLIPLGGLGEIGKNMLVVEHQDDILVVDAGLMFPENEMLGVDLVIPDVSGIVVTHGHEDHTGAIRHVMNEFDAPLFATPLTRGLLEVKLQRGGLLEKARINTINAGDRVDIGPFGVEFFHVCHSIPDGVGLGITTPAGLIVHSGDFKFDHTPVDGRLTDFAKLSQLGGQGVLALLSDSTNAETPGYTPSEKMVSEMFDRVFPKAPGRIIVATFASNISRIQQVIEAAIKHDRRVGIVGRSMVENVRMARDLGYLEVPEGVLLKAEEINRLPGEKVAIVTTGSQGEPTSALARMANGDFRLLQIEKDDTVIISARPIPGNEELVNHIINNLFKLGADVLYDQLLDVHVSGHASQEEEKLMLNLLRPRYFIPIHGEYRHLMLHAKLAFEVGIPPDNIFVIENGQVVEFEQRGARLNGTVPAGYVLVDGIGVGDVGQVVLRDRRLLSQDGVVIVTITVDKQTGRPLTEPDIISRGFVYEREAEGLLEAAREQVTAALEDSVSHTAEWSFINTRIKETLGKFFYDQTHRRPMILPVVMEV